jgi:hypothetical protein
MSSQGYPTNYAGSTGTFVPPGYQFSRSTIRDAADWTSFKRRRLIALEGPTGVGQYPSDPSQIMSGDRRIDYMVGNYEKGATGFGCVGCYGHALNATGNPYTFQYRQ